MNEYQEHRAFLDEIEACRLQFRNWWPAVPEGVTADDDLVLVNGFPRWVPTWSDGIHRIKLHWPDNLLA